MAMITNISDMQKKELLKLVDRSAENIKVQTKREKAMKNAGKSTSDIWDIVKKLHHIYN